MTLDEAIVHAREVAERNRNQYKNCPSDRTDIRHQTCEECAEEHEQLAEWLEELKKYREIGTPEECRAAVEKQKAKKPTLIDHKKYMDVVEIAKFLRGAYWCPNCNHVVKSGDFCNDCGQKLDWSDEERAD